MPSTRGPGTPPLPIIGVPGGGTAPGGGANPDGGAEEEIPGGKPDAEAGAGAAAAERRAAAAVPRRTSRRGTRATLSRSSMPAKVSVDAERREVDDFDAPLARDGVAVVVLPPARCDGAKDSEAPSKAHITTATSRGGAMMMR
mmetsp:Transcript_10577/g.31190  ORF Transcript_10577/g.31190 Transcript_10577/m.31190 type:complete len:143 (-) Transcript_10577:108-536(-)